jgi:hypothetical protein
MTYLYVSYDFPFMFNNMRKQSGIYHREFKSWPRHWTGNFVGDQTCSRDTNFLSPFLVAADAMMTWRKRRNFRITRVASPALWGMDRWQYSMILLEHLDGRSFLLCGSLTTQGGEGGMEFIWSDTSSMKILESVQ